MILAPDHSHHTVVHPIPGSSPEAVAGAVAAAHQLPHPGKPAATIKQSHESNVRLTITW